MIGRNVNIPCDCLLLEPVRITLQFIIDVGLDVKPISHSAFNIPKHKNNGESVTVPLKQIGRLNVIAEASCLERILLWIARTFQLAIKDFSSKYPVFKNADKEVFTIVFAKSIHIPLKTVKT